MKRRNFLILLSAPSGAGKTSVVGLLRDQDASLGWSVSCTTRPPRSNERHGKDYFFISHQEFRRHIADEAFLEYAPVFQNFYGTLNHHVDKMLAHQDVVLDVNWEGVQTIKKSHYPYVTVFLLPPSLSVLEKRLIQRGENSRAQIDQRLAEVQKEISYLPHYDYVLVNDVLEETALEFTSIVRAERLKRKRREVHDFLQEKFGVGALSPMAP